MIRAALFDLDGVLRQFDPSHPDRVEREAGLPAGTLGQVAFEASQLASELEALALTSEVDVVCNSWELGVAKPDLRVFAVAAERMGVRADECFVTDDRPENAEAATGAGMVAHHFTGASGLRAALRPILEG